MDQGAQTRLLDVQPSIAQSLDHFRVDIHPDHLQPMVGKSTGGRQPDVSQAHDADFRKLHNPRLRFL